ncbi:MAG: M28 family peptidase [Agriterribacter sp.]
MIVKCFTVLVLSIIAVPCFAQSSIKGATLVKDISYLASDKLAGRFPGTKGNELAAKYIEHVFKKNKIEPLFPGYEQPFNVIVKLEPPAANNFIKVGDMSDFLMNRDYSIFPFSGSAKLNAKVFAASSNEVAMRNPTSIKANWVVLWRRKSQAPASDSLSDYAISKKAFEEGAAGIILISPDSIDQKDVLVRLRPRKDEPLPIPVIQLSRNAWQKLTRALFDTTENDLQPKISSVPLTVAVQVEKKEITAKNIVGIIKGSDATLSNEYIILGAHYDHLGYGGYGTGSLQPDTIAIHNGADDNASGTAALMAIAAELSHNRDSLKRSVIIIAFSAEEEGLLGSQYFVNHLPVPKGSIKVMLNMDMVGHLNTEHQLYMGGAGTFPGGVDFMKKTGEGSALNLVVHAGSVGGSDHVSFYQKGISCVGLHTGGHPQYHKPSDDVELINKDGIEQVAKYIYQAMYGLTNWQGEWGFVQQD